MKKALVIVSFIASIITSFSVYTPDVPESPKKAKPKIGLVLGGGGAKGAAEIGVLKVLEKNNIKVDYVAGTSIGAIIGGLYCIGYTPDQLDTLFHSQKWLNLICDRDRALSSEAYTVQDGVTYLFGFPIFGSNKAKKERRDSDGIHGFGVLGGDSIMSLLNSMIHVPEDANFNEFNIPFRCVAMDILRMREVVLEQGNLARAMRASMAIPGVFKPVRIDGQILIDGGVLNNLPVDVVREMGADKVIAVDLMQNEESILNNLGSSKYNKNKQLIDVHIRPKLTGYDLASFSPSSIDDIMRIGEETASEQLKKIKKLRK